MGIGCDTLDFDALRKHGIFFGYTPGTNKLAVAELTISYIIAGLRWVMPLNMAMRNGERPRMRLGKGLTGRTVGIHGCGNVGKEVVRLLKPFNCKILVYWISPITFRSSTVRYGVVWCRLMSCSSARKCSRRTVPSNCCDDRACYDAISGALTSRLRARQHVPRRHRR